MIKGSILQEGTIILNVYVPKNRIFKAKCDRIGEIDKSSIILGDFNILLSKMDKSSRQKIRTQLNSTALSIK